MTLGPDGALWFTIGFVDQIGRLTTDGHLTTFKTKLSTLQDIVTGADGNLWYSGDSGAIYKMTTSGKSTLVRSVYEMGGLWSAYGHLWFWTAQKYELEEMATSGAIVKTYPVSNNCIPFSITSGPKQSIWFVDANDDCVARMTLSGKFLVVPTYYQGGNPLLIAHIIVGPKGYLWFNETGTSGLGWLDPSTM